MFLAAFLRLAISVGHTGIASGYVDPVARIAAQDEAVYSHSAIQMAVHGGWLTPVFLDRFALYKPPVLYWASGLSARVLGVNPLSLRLPSLLAGALLLTLVFYWTAQSWGLLAAAGVTVLLGSSHLFHTLSRLNLTDALLAFCLAASAYCLYKDPALRSSTSFWSFAVFAAAAILTKGVAGSMAVLLVSAFWLGGPGSLRRYLQLVACIGALAAPWFVYQLLVNQRWFWAEFVMVENIAFGAGSPPQTTNEYQAWFYIRRMFLLDPVLTVAAIASIPVWWKRKSLEAKLLLSWFVVVAAALMSYQYRNASYLLPVVVLFSLTAAPMARSKIFTMAVLPMAVAAKLYFPANPAGLPFQTGSTLASARPLQSYCESHRGNTLIVISPDDEFYSAVLPLPKVRYVYLSAGAPEAYILDFRSMGIILTAAQFQQLDALKPGFSKSMSEWGLPSDRALGTVILAPTMKALEEMIAGHPDEDFYLPQGMLPIPATHLASPATANRIFLLSKTAIPPAQSLWTCRL